MKLNINGLELIGAYGRQTNMQDWRAGKDFRIVGGPYCSRRDVKEMQKEGFQMLEFTLNGELLERIILDETLQAICENHAGTFARS